MESSQTVPHRSGVTTCTKPLCSPFGARIGFPDVFAARQQARTLNNWNMVVVSSVTALLGGGATASSILMLGSCCRQEDRTGVFSSDFVVDANSCKSTFSLRHTAHLKQECGSHPCIPSGCLWNGISCRRFLCKTVSPSGLA